MHATTYMCKYMLRGLISPMSGDSKNEIVNKSSNDEDQSIFQVFSAHFLQVWQAECCPGHTSHQVQCVYSVFAHG